MRTITRLRRRALQRLLQPSPHLELAYVRELASIMRGFTRAVVDHLDGHLRVVTRSDSLLRGFLDTVTEFLVAQIPAKVRRAFDRLVDALLPSTVSAQKESGVPVETNPTLDLARIRQRNIDLIVRAGRDYAADVAKVLDDPATIEMSVSELQALLVERAHVSESRAKLIATDQTLKLNAEIAQETQMAAGIESYVWSTCLDDRVRPTHAEHEGVEFRWDDPPVETGHPGHDINCRCSAIPVL